MSNRRRGLIKYKLEKGSDSIAQRAREMEMARRLYYSGVPRKDLKNYEPGTKRLRRAFKG